MPFVEKPKKKRDDGDIVTTTVTDVRQQAPVAPSNTVAVREHTVAYERPDAPPTMGLPRVMWNRLGKLYATHGWQWILNATKVSDEEYVLRLEEEVKDQLIRRPITVVTIGRKGGCGKTQGAVDFALTLADATNQFTLVADFNRYGNHAAPRIGIRDTEYTVLGLLSDRTILQNHRTMLPHIGYHPSKGAHNVRAITFDNGLANELLADPPFPSVVSLIKDLENVCHGLVIDGGQGLESNWNKAAIHKADVIHVNALVGQLQSDEDAVRILETVRTLDPDYHDKCMLVIHGHRGVVTPVVKQHYHDQYLDLIHQRGWDPDALVPVERIAVIPFDTELYDEAYAVGPSANREGRDHVMDSRLYKLWTRIAILEWILCSGAIARKAEDSQATPVTPIRGADSSVAQARRYAH